MITGGFLVQRPAVAAVVPIGKRYDSAHGSVNFYLFFFCQFASVNFVRHPNWSRARWFLPTKTDTCEHCKKIPVDSGSAWGRLFCLVYFFFSLETHREIRVCERESERPPHQDEGASCVFRWFSLEKNNGKNPTAMTRQKLMEITFNKIFHSSSFFLSFFLYLLT